MGISFGISDVGLTRQSNQDNFLIDEALGLVAVADGMGGHDGGEIASAEALSSLPPILRRSLELAGDDAFVSSDPSDDDVTLRDENMPAIATLFEALELANNKIYNLNLDALSPEGCGMGTTLTGFWKYMQDGPLISFHVGDSRLYRHRNGETAQLTRDQTSYQEALDAGATDFLPPRNFLLQAIGPKQTVEPEINAHATMPGDIYLLCSDGLHSATSDDEINDILSNATDENLSQVCERLIAIANGHGGKDNVTVVLTWCRS